MPDTAPATQVPSLEAFLRHEVAPRFQELLKAAEDRVAAAQKELEDLRGATGTMAWEVEGVHPSVWYVNLADGAMTVAATPLEASFMTVTQSEADWTRFAGGMAGLFGADHRRPLGRSRIERLRTLKGSVRFVLTALPDGSSWSCTLHFGPPPRAAEPQTTVTLAADLVKQIQSGQLNPQMAFMQGQVKLAGDPSLAMQLGMALFL